MKFIFEKKAQGAIEYLLIIAGAILLAAIVISVIVSTAKKGKTDVNQQSEQYGKILEEGNQLIEHP